MIMESKNQKKKTQESVRPAEFIYTSHTRDLGFQFERFPATFFGWTSCTYKARQFSYRRTFEASLSRRRFGSVKSRTTSRRSRFAA